MDTGGWAGLGVGEEELSRKVRDRHIISILIIDLYMRIYGLVKTSPYMTCKNKGCVGWDLEWLVNKYRRFSLNGPHSVQL